MSAIVHLVGDDEDARLPEGEVPKVRTRCGRTIDHPVVTANVGPTRYELVARNGNQFFVTTRREGVTCQKCRNLITSGAPMSTRLGPPSPRNEPWRPSPPPLPEQPGRTAVPAPEPSWKAAWRQFHDHRCADWTPRDTVLAKAGFMAGWAACNKVFVNPAPKKLTGPTLFPTMELGSDV